MQVFSASETSQFESGRDWSPYPAQFMEDIKLIPNNLSDQKVYPFRFLLANNKHTFS